MKTFDIKQELFVLQELMQCEYEVDEKTGEVTDNTAELKALADELNESLSDKADAIIYTAKEFKSSEDMLGQEIKRLQERKKQMQRKQEQLKDLLDYLLAGVKIKTEKFTVFYGKNESMVISEETHIPKEFIEFTPKINKTELKKAVKAGLVVTGVNLEENVSVRWR